MEFLIGKEVVIWLLSRNIQDILGTLKGQLLCNIIFSSLHLVLVTSAARNCTSRECSENVPAGVKYITLEYFHYYETFPLGF